MKILFIILFVFLSAHSFSQTCSLTLTGHVEDADIRDKLTGATIELIETGEKLVTDEKGNFVFNNLCKREYTIRISHVNCETITRKIAMEKNHHHDFFLPHARTTLGEVLVAAVQEAASGFEKEADERKLAESRGRTLAEALSSINGVTLLQTGTTISKPVIHGLHSNRILTINNGVRQEGQQWGNEHAPEIDPFIASNLVVVKGVDELRYGSDAIGGVILVEPKSIRSQPGYLAEINSAYFTNNKQYVLSAVFEQRFKSGFGYRAQGTLKYAANAATPDYRLNNTAANEQNFSATLAYLKNKFNGELFFSSFSNRIGIFSGSHIGNTTDLENAILRNKPDDVFLGEDSYSVGRPSQEVRHNLVKLKGAYKQGRHKFNGQIAAQFNNRNEFDKIRNSANNKPQLSLSISTLSEEITWEHPKTNRFNGIVGISMLQQQNSYNGRYFIPNYNAYTNGIYAIETWQKHNWELKGGVRFDHRAINTTRLKLTAGEVDSIYHNFKFSTFASSFNAAYKTGSWKLNTTVTLSSRAPHVNELLSDGIHHGTATFERGRIDLEAERSLNFAAGIQLKEDKFSFEIDIYSNNIKNFIYRQPLPDMPVLTTAGAFPLIEYRQTNAQLNGLDISASWIPSKKLQWIPKASILYAHDKKTYDWLVLMPANRLSNEIIYFFKENSRITRTYAALEIINVAKQMRTPDESTGKHDYSPPPAAYTLVNLNFSSTISIYKIPVTVSAGVRNMFNTRYRDYLNSMRYFTDETGRNIRLQINIPFTSNKEN